MLFLYRPPQTYMPYRVPLRPREQMAYNQQLQDRFAATRRVARPVPAADPPADRDPIHDLKELDRLHRSGALTDDEFAAAKTKLLGLEDDPS